MLQSTDKIQGGQEGGQKGGQKGGQNHSNLLEPNRFEIVLNA